MTKTTIKGKNQPRTTIPFKGFIALIALLWSLAIIASWAWNNHQEHDGVLEVARTQARTAHQKDIIYRRWNAGHGGVYVPKTEQTPSNPYLVASERDIVTPSGLELTLVNPAYMTRQVHEIAAEIYGVQGHITSLMPFRPENISDDWESNALETFENGVLEYSSVEQIKGEPYMRLIRPLVTEQSCMTCHEVQGYQTGDIRGGISVAVPMAPIYAVAAKKQETLLVAHGLLWALGIIGLLVASRGFRQRVLERDEAEAELAARNDFLDTVVESMTHPFVVIDVDSYRVVMANTEASRGKDIDSMLCYELLYQSETVCDSGEHECPLAYIKEHAEPMTYERLITDTSGGKRTLEIQAYPIKNQDDRVTQIVIYSRDISERKRIEAELLRSQKLESMGQLAGGLAHEINSPIQFIHDNIKFFSASLTDMFEMIEKYKDLEYEGDNQTIQRIHDQWQDIESEGDLEYLRTELPSAIHSSTEGLMRIAKIVRAMIDISKPGCREMQPVNVNELIESSTIVSKSSWRDVAELDTDLDTGLSLLPCIPGEFSQVILNLIFNSADAIRKAQVMEPERRGNIHISTRDDGEWAEIRVSDNGLGIPPDIHHRIFDPFFTTKDVGQGMGQGLMMVHALVTETHGGTISFETKEGVGTTFIIRLPVQVEELSMQPSVPVHS